MNIIKLILGNRYFVWALAIGISIFGIRSYLKIPIQLFPDTAPPMINVVTSWPGAAASDVNENLTRVLEEEFSTLEGVKKIKSSSQDNMSITSIEFSYKTNVDMAAVDVQNAVSRIRDTLPKGISEPVILKFSTADKSVITIGLAGKDLMNIRRFAKDKLAPVLQRIDGVASVDVFGGNDENIIVDVDLHAARIHNLNVQKISGIISGSNIAVPAGQIRNASSRIMYRLNSRVSSLDELSKLMIPVDGGMFIPLNKIAAVTRKSADDDSFFSINGMKSVAISVYKTKYANNVDVVHKVDKKIKQIKKDYPEIQFITGEESATFTETSIKNLFSNIWQALLLASLIIFLFLGRIKSSLVTVVSMPLSYLMTFSLMYMFNVEFNMVTLSAVILAVGMVVDSTVVVLENIMRFSHTEKPEDAVILGTSEVMLSVLAGSGTTLAVLIPLLFLEGFIGKTFGPLALTLVFSFSSAVVVALVLVPVLSIWSCAPFKWDKFFEKITVPFIVIMDKIKIFYVTLLDFALKFRFLSLLILLAGFAFSAKGLMSLGMEVLPRMDSGSFTINVETHSGSSLKHTENVMRKIEKILKTENDILKFQTQGGFEEGMKPSGTGISGSTQGSISITLTDRTNRKESIWEIQRNLREKISKVPGIKNFTISETGTTAKATTVAPVIIRITGENSIVLDKIASDIMDKIAAVKGISDIRRGWNKDQLLKEMTLNEEKIKSAGLNSATISSILNSGSGGLKSGEFHDNKGSPVDIRVRYKDRFSEDDLLNYLVMLGDGTFLPLRYLVNITSKNTQGLFTREDLSPSLDILASAYGRPLNFIIRDVEDVLKDITIPNGYKVLMTGEKSDLDEAKGELLSALSMALLLVYLLLVSQLRSFVHPLIIMFSIPLSITGVFLALKIAGKPLSMPVMVGLILLAGTVVNNGIILFEFIRQKRNEGMERKNALLESVETRFRPIMMTSLSTIAGMIPLAMEWALGAERFSPLAIAVIGGMTSATFLTMVFIPVLYDLVESLADNMKIITGKLTK
ncbi:MAG: efflux RND transporter permease subunit [Deltaproteobacteria bacterium]|nr:efflux RND transporter permease subunit [Deltaproteobacteria bacterium]